MRFFDKGTLLNMATLARQQKTKVVVLAVAFAIFNLYIVIDNLLFFSLTCLVDVVKKRNNSCCSQIFENLGKFNQKWISLLQYRPT